MKAMMTVFPAMACALLLAAPVNAAGRAAAPKGAMLGPAETLSGKIVIVDPAERIVIVQDAKGTTFEMRVTPSTRIRSGERSLQWNDLTKDTHKDVSVKFLPERSGDIAQSIEVAG